MRQTRYSSCSWCTVGSPGPRPAVNAKEAVRWFRQPKTFPFAFSAWTIRLLTRLPQKAVVAVATNVPGPRSQQKLMGRQVLEILPIPPIALHLRTGIAMLSYADKFIFGITADYDTAPDIEALAAGIEDGVARLVAASRARRRKPGPNPRAAKRPPAALDHDVAG